MGDVLITVKVMPDGVDTDLDALEERIRGLGYRVNNIDREPIAFGLVALMCGFVAKDEGGIADDISDAIKDLEGVSEAEVVEATLVS
jgi:elongation factor 1-beta